MVVMHFVWMAPRLASSKSPTKYASAASCRGKMACTWKHILYHPTSRNISQTRFKKGNLQIRRSVLFWNWQISQRATIPSQYLQGFFTLLAFRNFLGALPPTVSLSFFLADSSLPNVDGLASTAIWANCWVGDNSGDLPTSPQILHLCYPLLHLTWSWRGLHIRCWRFCQCWGFWFNMYFHPGSNLQGLPALLHSGHLLCSCHTGKESQPVRSQSSLMRVTWHLFWIN